MINLNSYLQEKKFTEVKQRKTQEWMELGKEISEYYHVKAYYLVAPYRNDLTAVRYAFKECQTRNMPFAYLASMLKLTKVK